jgi:hypothetical protein
MSICDVCGKPFVKTANTDTCTPCLLRPNRKIFRLPENENDLDYLTDKILSPVKKEAVMPDPEIPVVKKKPGPAKGFKHKIPAALPANSQETIVSMARKMLEMSGCQKLHIVWEAVTIEISRV